MQSSTLPQSLRPHGCHPSSPLPMPLPTRSQLRWQDDTPAWIFLAIKAWLVYMKTRETPW
jgi:hypothetical protein